jgi:hypothetical protein
LVLFSVILYVLIIVVVGICSICFLLFFVCTFSKCKVADEYVHVQEPELEQDTVQGVADDKVKDSCWTLELQMTNKDAVQKLEPILEDIVEQDTVQGVADDEVKDSCWTLELKVKTFQDAVQKLKLFSFQDIVDGVSAGVIVAVLELVYYQLPGVPGCSLRHKYWGEIDFLGGVGPPSIATLVFIETKQSLCPQLLDLVSEIVRFCATVVC